MENIKTIKSTFWLITLPLFLGCKIPYDPLINSDITDFLVVEGYIDGSDITVVQLSRTRALSPGDKETKKIEAKALVFVEDNHQNVFPLSESSGGIYSSQSVLNLKNNQKYRLRIKIFNGNTYLSDFANFKSTPNIDSIGWKVKDEGIQIYVNTQDLSGNTTFYRWQYEETWEFHSNYFSNIKYDASSNSIVPRRENVNICWQSASSTNILLASTEKFSKDVVNQAPLVYIEPHHQKLSVLYSIWIKQYALDKDEYNYWSAMKSNTEKLGSLFDAQPNQTTGNIHCLENESETVIGYIGAGNSRSKRTFVDNKQIPPGWNLRTQCKLQLVPIDSLRFYFMNSGLEAVADAFPNGYSGSSVECVDCTIAGTSVKPGFWP